MRTPARSGLVAVLLCITSVGYAQDAKVAAEALFDDARKLMTAGQYAPACAKFEQSQRLDPGIGTLLYLADCYEKAGRVASAWATFREGASQAKAAGQTERASAGESRARALEGRLSRLELSVSPANAALAGFAVRRGGNPVPRELWGVSVPVDGGEWTIEASASGARAWSKKVTVRAEGDVVTLAIPELEPESAASPPDPPPVAVTPAVVPSPASAPRAPTEDASGGGDTQRAIGLVIGGVGVIGVGFGSYFGLRAFSKNSDAESHCRGAVCSDPRGEALTNDAKDAAALSNVLFGVGLAALAGGAVVYLTAPSRDTRAVYLAPRAARNAGGVWLGGHF